ncbi:MAG: hypothetical protein Q9193_005839, partial [Seirophora villosa]
RSGKTRVGGRLQTAPESTTTDTPRRAFWFPLSRKKSWYSFSSREGKKENPDSRAVGDSIFRLPVKKTQAERQQAPLDNTKEGSASPLPISEAVTKRNGTAKKRKRLVKWNDEVV